MEFIYSFLSAGMDGRPAYGFSQRMRAAVEKPVITPSPQSYHAEKVSLGPTRAYTFGHRPRTNYVIDRDAPGPGEYFIGEERRFRRSKSRHRSREQFLFKDTPAYSFGVKNHIRGRNELFSNITPAPLAYDSAAVRKSMPSYSFGTKSRGRVFMPNELDSPGPGEYHNKRLSSFSNRQRGFSFGLRVRLRSAV